MRCLLGVKTRMRHGRHASHGHETQIEGSEEDSGDLQRFLRNMWNKHTHTYHLLSVIIWKSYHIFSSFEDIAFVHLFWKVTIRAIMVVMMIMLAVTAMDMDSMDTTMVTAIASGVVMAMTKYMDLWHKCGWDKMRHGWKSSWNMLHVAMIQRPQVWFFQRIRRCQEGIRSPMFWFSHKTRNTWPMCRWPRGSTDRGETETNRKGNFKWSFCCKVLWTWSLRFH